jgi:hypothetical protein
MAVLFRMRLRDMIIRAQGNKRFTFSLCHEDVRGRGGFFFFYLNTRWMWVVVLTPRPLYPWGNSSPLHWGGPRANLDGMEMWKFSTLLGLEPQPLHSQSLYWLCYVCREIRTFIGWITNYRRCWNVLSLHLHVLIYSFSADIFTVVVQIL